MTVEDLLQRALHDDTADVPEPPDQWADIERRAGMERTAAARRRARRQIGALATLGVAAAMAAALAIPALQDRPGHRVAVHPPATSPGGSVETTTATTTATATPAPTPTTATAPGSTAPGPGAGYQLLWPFASLADANAWVTSALAGGHSPWHLDAAQTALAFSRGLLGYTDINATFKTTMDAKGAHVAVGFNNPNGRPVTAAVVHLVRLGIGPDAPWEVVGTDDTPDFTLTTPGYGTAVGASVAVGGVISGVDESIKVQAWRSSSSTPVGVACCLAAGGTSSPWHTTLALPAGTGGSGGVLTIAASTGGHLAGVERFAVTGVRTRAAP